MKAARKHVLIGGIVILVILIGADIARQYVSNESESLYRSQHGDFTPPFKVGDLAPDFTLPDATGKEYTLASLIHGDTLLCFLCGCDHCRQMQINLKVMLDTIKSPPDVISITSAPSDADEAWRRDTGLSQSILHDSKEAGKPVTKQYRGDPCPRVYRLSGDRRITWIGPSPAQVRSMDDYGKALAQNLGYQLEKAQFPRPEGGAKPRTETKHDH